MVKNSLIGTLREIVWHNTRYQLPQTHVPVLVAGGIAYWDGENWRTRMELGHPIITWPVEHWTEIPKPPVSL